MKGKPTCPFCNDTGFIHISAAVTNPRSKPVKKRRKKIEPLEGYGVVVGGSCPYVWSFHQACDNPGAKERAEIECTEKHHKVKPMVAIPLADYRRLTRNQKAVSQ